MATEGEGAADSSEQNRLLLMLFRRPEKYKIGDDFDLVVKKSNLYFEAVELKDKRKHKPALLFNLSEDAFRLANPLIILKERTATKLGLHSSNRYWKGIKH